jgi:hypothetical protein
MAKKKAGAGVRGARMQIAKPHAIGAMGRPAKAPNTGTTAGRGAHANQGSPVATGR